MNKLPISVKRTIPASAADIWAVLADFPNIYSWNGGIQKSYSLGDQTEGVGAERHCVLVPFGRLDETVRDWVPEQRLVVSVDKASRLPLKSSLATFTLRPEGDVTEVTVDYEFTPKGGAVGAAIVGPALKSNFEKMWGGWLKDLDKASSA